MPAAVQRGSVAGLMMFDASGERRIVGESDQEIAMARWVETGARLVTLAAIAAVAIDALAGTSRAEAVAPVVAGYSRLKDEGKAPAADLGRVLLGELNCAQCHAAPQAKRILTKGAPDLSNIGARVTANWLRNYLTKPHEVKPGATMPDVFHASEAKARDGAVDFLVNYLVTLGGPIKP